MKFFEPFKHILTAFKNIKNFKKMVKDPVKSGKEADERKYQFFLPLLYISVILAITFVVLGGIVSSIFTILFMLFFFFALYLGLMVFMLNKIKKRFKDLECPKCKTTADGKTMYTYEIVKKSLEFKDKGKTNNNEPTKKIMIEASEYITVNITFTCSECGTTKSFMHRSRTMTCHKGGISFADPSVGNALVPQYEAQYKSAIQALYDKDISMGVGEIHPLKSAEVPKVPNTENGIVVTYNRSIDSVLAGYFNGTEIN